MAPQYSQSPYPRVWPLYPRTAAATSAPLQQTLRTSSVNPAGLFLPLGGVLPKKRYITLQVSHVVHIRGVRSNKMKRITCPSSTTFQNDSKGVLTYSCRETIEQVYLFRPAEDVH